MHFSYLPSSKLYIFFYFFQALNAASPQYNNRSRHLCIMEIEKGLNSILKFKIMSARC